MTAQPCHCGPLATPCHDRSGVWCLACGGVIATITTHPAHGVAVPALLPADDAQPARCFDGEET